MSAPEFGRCGYGSGGAAQRGWLYCTVKFSVVKLPFGVVIVIGPVVEGVRPCVSWHPYPDTLAAGDPEMGRGCAIEADGRGSEKVLPLQQHFVSGASRLRRHSSDVRLRWRQAHIQHPDCPASVCAHIC